MPQMTEAANFNVQPTSFTMQPTSDVSESNGASNLSVEKIHSLCLAVEICVVCGDRASGLFSLHLMLYY